MLKVCKQSTKQSTYEYSIGEGVIIGSRYFRVSVFNPGTMNTTVAFATDTTGDVRCRLASVA